MSLLDAAERFASIDRSQVLLDTKRCLHSQDQYSNCEVCFNVCPVDAITIGKPPALNTEICQSCLACIPSCPVGAYRADDDVSNLLNCITHVEGQPVELICELHPHPETGMDSESLGIRVHGCLAGLGTGAYLTLSALGLERIIPRTDACSTCKWHSLSPEIHHQAERANRFLRAWNRFDNIICKDQIEAPVERPVWDVKNPPLSRRDLFRMMARQGQVAMARAMENGVSASKHQLGRDRMRLLSAMSHLPEHSSGSPVNLSGFGFAALTISKNCTACGACGKACPTVALRFEKNQEETTFTISFSPQNCIGCDLCEHVCLPDAIFIDHAPTFEQVFEVKEPVIVESGQMVRCERCKTLMAAREDMKLCQLCEYRRAHPFGSILPKKITREPRS
ncbi:MAG: 4Fe-4S dicluster domain-containing protein [Anaerolineales bacterium]|nr:4Fe-4S dicluster domain-containing protein [Anaerolineales bacterium]